MSKNRFSISSGNEAIALQPRRVGRPDTGRFAEPPFATGGMAMTESRVIRIQGR
ncbi:hypothetical protein [Larkinella soli]|uniref:hypothetical protein n=1 Tax=Larkinella soli TaxID=1770527 RepID=UPI0013E33F9D|nr:hypothetical protein [Larkinella soli]